VQAARGEAYSQANVTPRFEQQAKFGRTGKVCSKSFCQVFVSRPTRSSGWAAAEDNPALSWVPDVLR
jgi:hypothetical protein